MPEFKVYQQQILDNCQVLLGGLAGVGYRIVTGGSDNHLFLVDLHPQAISGKQAEIWLDLAGITVNKNLIPFDESSAFETSGIRIGTPAVTTRGMKEPEMIRIAEAIDRVLKAKGDETVCGEVRSQIEELCNEFPLYADLHYE